MAYLRPAALLNASAVLPASLLWWPLLLLGEADLQESNLSRCTLLSLIGCGTRGHSAVCLLLSPGNACLVCGPSSIVIAAPQKSRLKEDRNA